MDSYQSLAIKCVVSIYKRLSKDSQTLDYYTEAIKDVEIVESCMREWFVNNMILNMDFPFKEAHKRVLENAREVLNIIRLQGNSVMAASASRILALMKDELGENTYVIFYHDSQNNENGWVGGFHENMESIIRTSEMKYAKEFKTKKEAEDYMKDIKERSAFSDLKFSLEIK